MFEFNECEILIAKISALQIFIVAGFMYQFSGLSWWLVTGGALRLIFDMASPIMEMYSVG